MAFLVKFQFRYTISLKEGPIFVVTAQCQFAKYQIFLQGYLFW